VSRLTLCVVRADAPVTEFVLISAEARDTADARGVVGRASRRRLPGRGCSPRPRLTQSSRRQFVTAAPGHSQRQESHRRRMNFEWPPRWARRRHRGRDHPDHDGLAVEYSLYRPAVAGWASPSGREICWGGGGRRPSHPAGGFELGTAVNAQDVSMGMAPDPVHQRPPRDRALSSRHEVGS